MEILHNRQITTPVRAVVFDFDGTLSTLRCGWEEVMKPLMLEMISGGKEYDEALEKEVDAYIDESTGIQTIHQMKWLAATIQKHGKYPDAPTDPWWYKDEYNRRLMQKIRSRIESVSTGSVPASVYRIKGSEAFLKTLCERGVKLYAASGTDHPDVCKEASVLGLDRYFTQIAGAPLGVENCSKEKVITDLMNIQKLRGDQVAVIGDGKIEIRLGQEIGARTIGLATDERNGGIDAIKRKRLIDAGTDIIAGDFTEIEDLLRFLGL